MRIILAIVDIKPGYKEPFMEEMLADARGSVQNKPGCLRFDVLQDDEDPNRIYLYEVYRDAAAEEAHAQTPHFLRWQEAVKDWFATPIDARFCTNVHPSNDAWQ